MISGRSQRNLEVISTSVYLVAQDYGKENETTPDK
jgi:hypothetical protein